MMAQSRKITEQLRPRVQAALKEVIRGQDQIARGAFQWGKEGFFGARGVVADEGLESDYCLRSD